MRLLTMTLIIGAIFISAFSVDARFRFGRRRRHHGSFERDEDTTDKTKKAKELRDSAAEYEKKAEAAEKEGKKKLAGLYKECAKCKKTMADGVEGNADRDKVIAAWKKYKETLDEINKLTGQKATNT